MAQRIFCIVDNNFEELAFFRGVKGLGFQNIACDDEFIYLLDSGVKQKPGVEIIRVYDWDGYFRGVCRLNYASESEAIFIGNGKMYIGFYTGGGRVFEMHFDKELMREKIAMNRGVILRKSHPCLLFTQ